MNVGPAIRIIRKQLNISQYELADKSKISQTSLSQIENGIKRPSPKTMKKVCEALDIPEAVIYILALDDAHVPESKRAVYKIIYPSIKSLALQIVGTEYEEHIEAERA